MCLYKSQTHVPKYRKFQLSADREKNPGPTQLYIDPCKTIRAWYSQANELVFRFTIANKESIILLMISSQ